MKMMKKIPAMSFRHCSHAQFQVPAGKLRPSGRSGFPGREIYISLEEALQVLSNLRPVRGPEKGSLLQTACKAGWVTTLYYKRGFKCSSLYLGLHKALGNKCVLSHILTTGSSSNLHWGIPQAGTVL